MILLVIAGLLKYNLVSASKTWTVWFGGKQNKETPIGVSLEA